MAEGEISIEEMFGAPKGTAGGSSQIPSGSVSVEDMFSSGPDHVAPPSNPDGFLARTKRALGTYKDMVLHATPEERWQANIGFTKALTAGAVDLGQMAFEGLTGLLTAREIDQGGTYAQRFERGQEKARASAEKLRDFTSKVTGVNLAVEGKEQEAMANLLAVIPDAITAAGDTVYDKTGSAVAGAGTQALLTFLTLKPGVATKSLKALGKAVTPASKASKEAAAKIRSTYDELAIKDPDAAAALAEHVSLEDPALGKEMLKRLETARKASPEKQTVAGEKAALAELNEQRELQLHRQEEQLSLGMTRELEQLNLPMAGGKAGDVLPKKQMEGQLEMAVDSPGKQLSLEFERRGISHEKGEAGDHVITSPNGELHLQETNGGLQVKRIDVAKAAQSKGEGMAMMMRALQEADSQGVPLISDVSVSPAAARLYSKLKEKGYEVKQNPATRSETTGNLVSADPRKGVYEVRIKRDPVQRSLGLYSEPGGQAQIPLRNAPGDQLSLEVETAQPRRAGQQTELDLPRGSAGTQLPMFSAEAVSAGIAKTVKQGYETMDRPARPPSSDPTLYIDRGEPIKKSTVQNAFSIGKVVPGWDFIKGKLNEYYRQLVQTFNPEGFGPEAKQGAAILAKNMAIQMQKDSQYYHRSLDRRRFWNQRASEASEFIKKFEKGEKFSDPVMQQAAEAYRKWNEEIYKQDQKLGIEYAPEDNYLYHLFEDSKGVEEFFARKYGKKWGDPKFTKERSYSLYEEAVEAGFKPKFTNPEDIMLARQHASDIAEMRVQALAEMERFGLAQKVGKGGQAPPGWPAKQWRAPNGETYFVHENASTVLNNAFETQSLWTLKGLGGDAFRGMMELKNTIVPIKLALSLFHPLHVLTIHNATGMVRATKGLLAGTISPTKWLAEMGKAAVYADFFEAPRTGGRALRAFQGKIKDSDLTVMDRESLQFMFEGGFTPEMAAQYKTGAINRFRDAVQKGQARALWHAPFAAIQAMQKPLFEHWIPALKSASYLKDVKTALKADPSLMEDPLRRQVLFRKLAKSVDNRYGEMAYSTLFWNRWVKDLAVANTLSLGWQLGFIREYGGGLMDVGQFGKGGMAQKVKAGNLDRPLFVTYYTTQALAYGGLMTWALSGQFPQDLMDYVFPKNGEKNPRDGSDQRVSTMLYPREFVAIYKHMEHEGILPGLGHVASNKASGTVGLIRDWATGVNSFGQEVRDPEAPALKQLQQTLAYSLGDLEPISVGDIREQMSEKPVKTGVMSILGFSVAPKYITETKTQSSVKQAFQKYIQPQQTPYEKALFSDEMRKLRKLYDAEQMEKYDDLLGEVAEKFELSPKDLLRIRRQAMKDEDPSIAMFKRLPWQVQKKLLDKMSEEERENYLPAANRDHLKFRYEAPEER